MPAWRYDESQTEYGCIFCETGAEDRLVKELEHRYPDISALNVVKLRYRRVGGKPVEEQVTLFPGYVFVRVPLGQQMLKFYECRHALKLLKYADGTWMLKGSDRTLVQGLYGVDGVLGFSKAYYDKDQRIRIIEGPLKAYEGSIIRVNHRKQTAEVQMMIHGVDMKVWLGFEIMEKVDEGFTGNGIGV